MKTQIQVTSSIDELLERIPETDIIYLPLDSKIEQNLGYNILGLKALSPKKTDIYLKMLNNLNPEIKFDYDDLKKIHNKADVYKKEIINYGPTTSDLRFFYNVVNDEVHTGHELDKAFNDGVKQTAIELLQESAIKHIDLQQYKKHLVCGTKEIQEILNISLSAQDLLRR